MSARYFNVAPRAYSPSRPVASSENEREENDQELVDEVLTSPNSDTWRVFTPQHDVNSFQIAPEEIRKLSLQNTSKGAILSMPSRSCFALVGVCSVTVLRGSISLMGVHLHASHQSHTIFSPRSSHLAVIEALNNTQVENTTNLPPRISGRVGDASIIILLQPLKTGIESLGRYRILSQLFQPDEEDKNPSIDEVIGVEGLYFVDPSALKPQLQPFVLHDSWSNALNSSISNTTSGSDSPSSEPFIGLVKGPKNCGKSTFARTLLNTLLTRYVRVAYLECDIGQSEFMPSGLVSLHVVTSPIFGPPFTHPTLPFRAHYIGSATPRSGPSHYIAAIQSLMETYRLEIQNSYEDPMNDDNRLGSTVPLVINTQGWTKGLGADLLEKIEDLAAPTAIFVMELEDPHFNHNQRSNQVYHIQPILSPTLTQYFTPTDHRTFAILSYFHASFAEDGTVTQWNTENPLCAHRPWEVVLRKAIDKIILTGAGAEDVVPEELHPAINCSLVGLICDDHAFIEVDGSDAPYYTQGDSLPLPSHTRCVGLALVRGVDLNTRRLHLLTPIPPKLRRNCRTLVKGELEMPVWGMVDFRDERNNGVAGVSWGKVPYLQMGRGDVGVNVLGAARRRVRRNVMRKNQMPA